MIQCPGWQYLNCEDLFKNQFKVRFKRAARFVTVAQHSELDTPTNTLDVPRPRCLARVCVIKGAARKDE